MQTVKIINPRINTIVNSEGVVELKRKRVCAYARVSTDNIEQKSSYDAQIDEYRKRIQSNPEWEFVGIYADEGLSGTSTKHRVRFNEMINRVRSGDIDLILTKSISRFTRNTVDCLNYIREFRLIGVDIYFEKENIYSSDPKVEFLLTIMSSIAQEEARNVSENVKWTIKKRYNDGVAVVNTKRFLGYTKDSDTKQLIIVPEEAVIVKDIFTLYANGVGPAEICKICAAKGYKTGAGCEKWSNSTIHSILRNEKYYGDLLLGKTVTIDYLNKKRVKNKNLEPMYHVENAHPGIITKELFEKAQSVKMMRSNVRIGANKDLAKYNRRYPFSGIIICNQCGRTTKRRYWNHGYASAKIVQQCGGYIEGKANCTAKAVDQDLIEGAVLDVINNVFKNNPDIFKNLMQSVNTSLLNTANQKINELNDKRIEISNELDSLIKLSSLTNGNDDYFKAKFNDYSLKLQSIDSEITTLDTLKAEDYDRAMRLQKIKEVIYSQENEFTELTVDIVKALFYRIITISKSYIVITITSNPKIIEKEFIENRENIIKLPTIYENIFTSEKTNNKMHFKVVIV